MPPVEISNVHEDHNALNNLVHRVAYAYRHAGEMALPGSLHLTLVECHDYCYDDPPPDKPAPVYSSKDVFCRLSPDAMTYINEIIYYYRELASHAEPGGEDHDADMAILDHIENALRSGTPVQ